MAQESTPQFRAVASQMKRSIPGEGMSNDPENPYSFEQAPEFAVHREALEYLFVTITDEDKYVDILMAIEQGVPIMELTQVILFKGFTEGKWNPDLMILLAEPLAFMLMALAERQGIDYVINRDDAEDEAEDERKLSTTGIEKRLKEKQQAALQGRVSTLPPAIVERIEEVPIVESLLAEQEKPETAPDSLLGQQGA
jgi:hypothetical protein